MDSRVIFPLDFEVVNSIPSDMRYASSNNFTGQPLPGYSAPKALLRKQVHNALKKVQASLITKGYSLCILDAYRPKRAVRAMVQWAKKHHPELLKQDYISPTSKHSQGIAVDVTLLKITTTGFQPIDMGTDFDSFCTASHTLNPNLPPSIHAHRLLLVHEMEQMGFINYHQEWWHFTFVGQRLCGRGFDFDIW